MLKTQVIFWYQWKGGVVNLKKQMSIRIVLKHLLILTVQLKWSYASLLRLPVTWKLAGYLHTARVLADTSLTVRITFCSLLIWSQKILFNWKSSYLRHAHHQFKDKPWEDIVQNRFCHKVNINYSNWKKLHGKKRVSYFILIWNTSYTVVVWNVA